MPKIQRSQRPIATGFTLIELLIALALMGILAAWGLPNFQALGERSAVTSEVNRLQTALTLARNTAITQRSDVTVCPADAEKDACADNWSGQLMVVSGDGKDEINDSDILRIFPATKGATTISKTRASTKQITYDLMGKAMNRRLYICPATQIREDQQGKEVVIYNGRARVGEDPIDCSSQ